MSRRAAVVTLAVVGVLTAGTLLGWRSVGDDPAAAGPTTPTTQPTADAGTFGALMRPSSNEPVGREVAYAETSTTKPTWWDDNELIRWDRRHTFTMSLKPEPFGTMAAEQEDAPQPSRTIGAEFVLDNPTYKNADVRFTVTGRKFAIRYVAYGTTDAMVWIDGAPVAAKPLTSRAPAEGQVSWIYVTLPERRTVDVRFAGPIVFTGVDHDLTDPVTIRPTKPIFTLGIVSDSWYEPVADPESFSRSGAPMLATLTGFRVWNMAQGSSGYINDGTNLALDGTHGTPGHYASAFGSPDRLESLRDAPIDALLVNGSINDTLWTRKQHRAAVDAYLDRVEEVRPDLPVVILGIEPFDADGLTHADRRAFARMNATLATMVGRHDNVVGFIDAYGEDWLTGTGSADAPIGDGNQDYFVARDHAHLNGDGHEYYQRRVVDQLRSMSATVPR